MDNMHWNKQDVRAALYCVVSHVILCQLLRLVPVNQKTNVIEAKCGWKILRLHCTQYGTPCTFTFTYFFLYSSLLFPPFTARIKLLSDTSE